MGNFNTVNKTHNFVNKARIIHNKKYDYLKVNNINKKTNKTFGELYNNTINRENILKSGGYQFISIWENDLKELNVI